MPPASIRQYKAAVVQSEPGWFDLQRSVQMTVDLILEAGEKGCMLIAFPEIWIPGYPYWLWRVTYQDSLSMVKDYHQNSLRPNSAEMDRIRGAARNGQVYVSLGYSEIDGNSLYIAQIFISPTGDVINHRRKIKPTHVERLMFGEGSGDSLNHVVETEIGAIGHLNCWENVYLNHTKMNPFLKAHSCALNEQVHVAAWPVLPPTAILTYPDPFANISELQSELVTPAYALETGTWTLAPCQVVTPEGAKRNIPRHLRADKAFVEAESAIIVGNGFARIYRPDGHPAVEKPAKNFRGLVIANIDLDENILSKQLTDFGGHCARPDLIRLLVDKLPKTCIVDANAAGPHTFQSTLERLGLGNPLTLDDH